MMEPPCELRIIRISWARKDESTDVKTAQQPIRLEQGVDGWVAEVPAYPEVEAGTYGQLAVAIPDGTAKPSLLLANDDSFPLTVVKAPDGREWWIEKGKWKKTKYAKYHDAPLCRHVGEARLRVGNEVIRLRIAPAGFTGEDFELLLDEFRNGAWQLILEPLSPTRGTDWRGDGGIDPAFLAAVSEFVRYVGRALDQPHRELREVRQLQRLERVRPNIGTFRELAVRGSPRMVSGRGHAPSFNTPENRRLLWMCIRLRRMLSGLLAGAEASKRDLFGRAHEADERAAYLQESQGKVRVDQSRLARLIEEREDQLIAYQQAVGKLLTDLPPNIRTTSFDLKKPNPSEYNGIAQVWFDGRAEDGRLARFCLEFYVDLQTLKTVFDKRYCYRLIGNFDLVRSGISQSGRPWSIWSVAHLTEISPMGEQYPTLEKALRSEIDTLKGHRPSHGNTDFWKRLNKADADEQRRDLMEARASADRLRVASELWTRIASQVAPLVAQLSALEAKAQKMGIKEARQAAVIGSMTWVMNPDYRGALGAYRNAQAKADLNASQLEGLLRLEDLGVIDLPMIYERWCLLRLVAMLRTHFHLSPPSDLQGRLLESVIGEKALSVRFEGPALGRDVLLEYQPRLQREGVPEQQRPNPDFMLTVLARNHDAPIHGTPRSRLVLDAKCKPFLALGEEGSGLSLVEELDELIGRKKYHEPDDHRVFVLHPGSGSDAAQREASYCHLGGSHLVSTKEERKPWDDESCPDHRYGFVLLRPRVADPLIRLILMHLYLGLDDSIRAYDNRRPACTLICPVCGSTKLTDEPPVGSPMSERPGRAAWCVDCGRMLIWNYSGGCGTHLFKLGGHWTFHDTHPLNPYNIRCPHCGDFMPIRDSKSEPDDSVEPDDWGESTCPF